MSQVTAAIYDLASNALSDISDIALEKSFTHLHNQARQFTIQAPAGSSLLTAAAADGDPILRTGSRKLIVWENGGPGDQPLFHGRIRTVERTGDGKQNLVSITAADPLMELGYESSDIAGRPVRDSTANLINPTFSPSVANTPADAISGPDLIKQILTNSQNTDPLLGEGPLPIDLTSGTFDLNIPPAVDLSALDTMDWPILCGDFIQQLTQTGVVDIDLRPVDPSEGFDPYIMVALSAVNLLGTDRSATVHFDYWTGSHNASQCRHTEDFNTVDNKPFYYLAPKSNQTQFKGGNIAPDSPGVVPDPTASRAKYGGPGTDKGQFMSIRIVDGVGDATASRPLTLALYNGEFALRLDPRNLLFITPAPDAEALFDPPTDYAPGDNVAINTGADFGITLAESQRVYGYQKTWTRENVARVSQLYTSADQG